MILVAVVVLALATPTPTEEAAAAETEAFAALDDNRDCDAAAAFLRAYSLLHDERLLLNAGMAFERAGDTEAARETLEAVEDPGATAKAAARLRGLGASNLRCPPATTTRLLATPKKTTTTKTPATTQPTTTTTEPATTEAAAGPLLGIGVAALATGVVVGAATAAGAGWQSAVLGDSSSAGGAKETAIAASAPLIAGGSLAVVCVVAGAIVLPLALLTTGPSP